MNYAPVLLSGSTGGAPIPVVATGSPGTLIHTAVAGATSFDEVWLWVSNVTGAAVALTIEFGGLGVGFETPGPNLIPANSSDLICIQGKRINGGAIVRAFAGTANALNISGNVNRITS